MVHHRYLEILMGHNGPIGIGSIAAKMRQSQDMISCVECILLELDFVTSTPRGRVITEIGLRYISSVLKKS